MFFQINKSKNFVPGFICVLHTFGRPLEWNPHIHCPITEGGFSDDGFWRVVKHFNYPLLRKSFQTALLNEMEKRIGPSVRKTKAHIYKKDSNGFYVFAKPNLCSTQTVIQYISRYLGRPVIALNRMDSYEGENVTFHYNRHEDNAFVEKTIPALDFISLLIQHIPEPHYKMTRYYGLYARHRSGDKKRIKAVSFGYDPICCPNCKTTMTLTGLYFIDLFQRSPCSCARFMRAFFIRILPLGGISYYINKTRPPQKSRFVHQLIPKGCIYHFSGT